MSDSTGRRCEIFAYESLHFAAIVGKKITRACYGQNSRYSYFMGCSTGDRQALALAQRYPHDYDGIVSGAPANNHTELATAMLWPAASMLWANNVVCAGKFQAAEAQVPRPSAQLDAVKEGVERVARRPESSASVRSSRAIAVGAAPCCCSGALSRGAQFHYIGRLAIEATMPWGRAAEFERERIPGEDLHRLGALSDP